MRRGDAQAATSFEGAASGTGRALLFDGRGFRPTSTFSDGIILPGFVNAHSHAFQRVLRGRAEGRGGDFWSWREQMYRVASRFDPEQVYVASRAAFLEMLLAGFTSVVEFHYLHNDPAGQPYDDPDELSKAVLRAARSVGIRICLLETAYARSEAGTELEPAQLRFADRAPDAFVARAERVRRFIRSEMHESGGAPGTTFGVALHSVRALPRHWLETIGGWALAEDLPLHMHVAEQPAEVESCIAEHGLSPVALLDDIGILGRRFVGVHAIHISEAEITLLARAAATVCVCPSTEGNLGDGFAPAAALARAGVQLCIGTDSHASIDPFSEIRELDYRERLRLRGRQGVAPPEDLLRSATTGGRAAGAWPETDGTLASAGPDNVSADDLVVLDPLHPALRGTDRESLGAHIQLAGSPAMVRAVYVGGRQVIEEGRHKLQDEILDDFDDLQRRVWQVAGA